MNTKGADGKHVRLQFDMHAKPFDMISGKALPQYTQAQRGSFLFYEDRLDSPVDHLNYMFAPMVRVRIQDLIMIRKLTHPNIWALVTQSGAAIQGLNPVMTADIVKQYALSFIPIHPVTGIADARAHVLLRDMYLIQWGEIAHWLSEKGQREYESEKGRYW